MDVEFPAELTDISDAAGSNPGISDVDLSRGGEREGYVGEVSVRQAGQKCPGIRAHDAEDGHAGSDVNGYRPGLHRDVGTEPCEVADLGRRGSHDKKARLALASYGKVGLDAAAFVEPLRVDDPSRRDCDVGCADSVQHHLRIRPFDDVLAEGRLVE